MPVRKEYVDPCKGCDSRIRCAAREYMYDSLDLTECPCHKCLVKVSCNVICHPYARFLNNAIEEEIGDIGIVPDTIVPGDQKIFKVVYKNGGSK